MSESNLLRAVKTEISKVKPSIADIIQTIEHLAQACQEDAKLVFGLELKLYKLCDVAGVRLETFKTVDTRAEFHNVVLTVDSTDIIECYDNYAAALQRLTAIRDALESYRHVTKMVKP